MKTFDLHVIDIVQNSIRAQADQITIAMEDSEKKDLFSITITDNGCGMPQDMLEAINSSFFTTRTTRKIGMGIALLKYHSQICNGHFYLKSELGVGTEIYADYQRSHIDMQPKGDLAGCLSDFICQYQNINFIVKYVTDDNVFELSSNDIKEIFEGVDLNNYKIISMVKELIAENTRQ